MTWQQKAFYRETFYVSGVANDAPEISTFLPKSIRIWSVRNGRCSSTPNADKTLLAGPEMFDEFYAGPVEIHSERIPRTNFYWTAPSRVGKTTTDAHDPIRVKILG